jgi:hypothetical protein
MTLLEYIRDVAPKVCGVHPSFGKVAELVYNAEISASVPEFEASYFTSARERAELAMPYQVIDTYVRMHVLNVIELAICTHRQAKHEEDHSGRIAVLLLAPMSVEEKEMATRDWWII